MPLRCLRPGLKDSVKWNSLDWRTQSFYVRIMNVVDDFGCYHGDPKILRGHCFAMRDDVSTQDVISMCDELLRSKILFFYEHEGQKYLQLTNWQERVRSKRKFPQPSAVKCQQVADKCTPPTPTPPPTPTHTPAVDRPPQTQPPPPVIETATPEACVYASEGKNGESEASKNRAAFELQQRTEWLMAELCKVYRRPSNRLTQDEETLLVEISRRPSSKAEFRELLGFRGRLPAADRRFFPQSIRSLLTGWDATLDKARVHVDTAPKSVDDKILDENIRAAKKTIEYLDRMEQRQ